MNSFSLSMGFQSMTMQRSAVGPTMKFEFPAPFAPQTPHSCARGGCCPFKWGDPPNPPLSRHPRYAKTLYAHPRCAKILHSPFRMAIFDSSHRNGQTTAWQSPWPVPVTTRLGWMLLLWMGGPRKPPIPATGVDVAPSNGGTPQTPPLLRHPRYAKTLYMHLRYAKILHSPFQMAIFDTSSKS